jgi:hypothetical protein
MSGKKELARIKASDYPALKSSRGARDILVHTAVTINNSVGGIELIGVKDHEICQFAAEWQGRALPVPEHYVKEAFREMEALCIEKMRSYGLLR